MAKSERPRRCGPRAWPVDGHPDALDGATSPTGEAADMDLAAVGPAWLHIGLDALDQDEPPAVTYRQPMGLTWTSSSRCYNRCSPHPV